MTRRCYPDLTAETWDWPGSCRRHQDHHLRRHGVMDQRTVAALEQIASIAEREAS